MTSSQSSDQALAEAADDWEASCSGGGIRLAARCLWALQSLGPGGLAAKARWLRRLACLLVCVLAVPAAYLPGATGAAAAVTSWSSGTVQANVNAVSCSAPSACTAVGDYVNSSGSFVPLVMRWNGKTWRMQRAPAGGTIDTFLFGVSCPSATYCVAVGQTEVSGGVLPSATPFAEQWNGTTWSVLPSPRSTSASVGFLFGVSCSSARSCEVVGNQAASPSATVTVPLAARWNGKSWAPQTVSLPTKGAVDGALSAVSCVSATRCATVGGDGTDNVVDPMVGAWNGRSWTTATAPLPKGASTPPLVTLQAVSCGSASSCTALGYSAGRTKTIWYSASGSGTRWKDAPIAVPKGATRGALDGISCVAGTATWCMAAGSYSAHGKAAALAEKWDGRAWTLTAAPAGTTQPANTLLGVSCRATTTCQAAGTDGAITPGGLSRTLAERWNRKSWTIEHTPQPPPGMSRHAARAAPTSRMCIHLRGCPIWWRQEQPTTTQLDR